MDQIAELWPSAFALLIVPLMVYLKKKVNAKIFADVPFLWWIVQVGLSVVVVYVLKLIFVAEITAHGILMFVFANMAVATGGHAFGKSFKKVKEAPTNGG